MKPRPFYLRLLRPSSLGERHDADPDATVGYLVLILWKVRGASIQTSTNQDRKSVV